MNMLIIGNGFDLAHGRPTRYKDFLHFAGQIMRTKNYNGGKDEFKKTLSKFHSNVEEFILAAFDSRAFYGSIGRYNKNSTIQEIYNCLEENVWYEYFFFLMMRNRMRGKNWVDFESEILHIILFFDQKINDLYEPLPSQLKDFGPFDYKVDAFWARLNFSKYNRSKSRNENYNNTCFDFIEKTYQDLENLIRCLEIYLDDCVGKIPVTCYSPDIQGLQIDSVLNFNYTAIPTGMYPSLANTHYIHGCAKTSRPAVDNNMVLGVNEYWIGSEKDIRTNFNLYKKFVQRIIKETGINYKDTLLEMQSDFDDSIKNRTLAYTGPQYSYVYIFGHSLDVTDGDILRETIRTPGVITTIFYRNKQQQANQIANLSKVLGQDELLKRTFSTSPTIIFKKQADMREL